MVLYCRPGRATSPPFERVRRHYQISRATMRRLARRPFCKFESSLSFQIQKGMTDPYLDFSWYIALLGSSTFCASYFLLSKAIGIDSDVHCDCTGRYVGSFRSKRNERRRVWKKNKRKYFKYAKQGFLSLRGDRKEHPFEMQALEFVASPLFVEVVGETPKPIHCVHRQS